MGILDSIRGMFGGGAPPPTEPPPPTDAPDVLPLNVDEWRARITACESYVKDLVAKGRKRVNRYRMKHYLGAATLSSDTIQVPVDFWNVEQKRAQLFYRVPEGVVHGKNPRSQQVAPTLQAVMNEYVGPSHLNAKATMDQMIFDVLCPMGIAGVKFGYETWTEAVENPMFATDPTQPPTIDVPAGGRYLADRIPPGRLRGPFAEFTGSDFDEMDWIGYRFFEPAFDGEVSATSYEARNDDLLSEEPRGASQRGQQRVRWGTYVSYRRRQFDKDTKNPDVIFEFELMDGDDAPRLHRPQPCPNFLGHTIKLLTIRYVSDRAVPPSDCEITEVLTEELSRGRSQALVARNRSLPQNLYDALRVKQPTLDKIERGDIQGNIGHDGPITEDLFKPLNKGELPRETYAFNDVIGRDIERAWGLGANQSGITTDTTRTATELQIIENAKDTRLDYERDKVTAFYTSKFLPSVCALLQHYATVEDVIAVTDERGAQTFVMWSKQDIQGEFAFTIKVNSQLRPDAAADVKKAADMINFAAKSPFINQAALWRDFIEAYGRDPAQYIVQPPPPQPEPVMPSLKGEDLDPVANPLKYANVYAMLQKFGMTLPVTPDMAMLATLMASAGAAQQPGEPDAAQNPTTDGTADVADVLTKHTESGRLPGSGSEVAEMTGAKVM
jgi:hypothetical protein